MNEKEAYLVLHKASGIKVGDRVKVLRKAADYEMGWDNTWKNIDMTKKIGEELTVDGDMSKSGFHMQAGYSYPFFVLERVSSAPVLPASITDAIESGDFGCRTESVKKLARAIYEAVRKEKQ